MSLSFHPTELDAFGLIYISFIVFFPLLALGLCYNRFRDHLSSVPGPFINSISSLPRIWSVWEGNSHWDDLELHKKYGKIVRVSPTTVSVCDLALFDSIYGISSRFYKAGFYEPCRFYDEEGLIPDPLVIPDKELHTRMKRNAANAYSLQALVQIEPLVDEVLKNLLDHFDVTYVAQHGTCDLGRYMLYFAMVCNWILSRLPQSLVPKQATSLTEQDAIFTITFGQNLDLVRKGDPKNLCHQISSGLPYIACVSSTGSIDHLFSTLS